MVIGRSPAAGALGVGVSAVVTATFNEQVRPLSLAFELRDEFFEVVPAAVSYNQATRTVTLDPVSPLITPRPTPPRYPPPPM